MYAGSIRVVASLWKVDDAATAELIARFYRGCCKCACHCQPHCAEHSWRMSKQQQWKEPYYSAGFILQGEVEWRRGSNDSRTQN
jgi:CHAT domain-containing protein